MAATIRMLIPMVLLFFLYLTTVESRFREKITYTYTPKMWQKNLPDSRKLNTLAFIGTRDPPTFEPSVRSLPRLLPLADKLTVGIRVFDIGVRRINNDFAMYNSSFNMQAIFYDLVIGVKTFLKKNPEEFVVMIMHAESTALKSTLSECEILRTKYVQKYPNLFVQQWSLDDTVGQHRGKILLLEKSPEFSGCTAYQSCAVRDQLTAPLPAAQQTPGIEYYSYVKGLHDEVAAQTSKCYLFYYTSERDIFFPPKLTFNKRIDYINDFNEAKFPETIDMVSDYFNNTKNCLFLTVADLPPLSIINKIIDSN